MKSRFKLACIILSVQPLLFSCANRVNTSGSEVSHAIGDVRVMRTEKLKNCDSKGVRDSKEKLPQSHAYVSAMIDHMTSTVNSTGAKTFTGFLDRKNLCVQILFEKKAQRPSAFGDPQSGLIQVTASFLELIESDEELAGPMGHELAHITLNHSFGPQSHVFRTARLLNKSKWQKVENEELSIMSKLKEQNLRLSSAWAKVTAQAQAIIESEGAFKDKQPTVEEIQTLVMKSHEAKGTVCHSCAEFRESFYALEELAKEREVVAQKVQSLASEFYGKEVAANKRHSDADEIGFEFYARSGFDLKNYFTFLTNRLKDTTRFKECLRSKVKIKDRGLGEHPDLCYRVHSHSAEYNSHLDEFSGWGHNNALWSQKNKPSLGEVQSEIKRMRR